MTINRKISQSIRNNIVQFASAIFLFMVGCFAFNLFGISYNVIKDNYSQYRNSYMQEDAQFVTQMPLHIPHAEDNTGTVIEERGTFDLPLTKTVTVRIFSETQKVNIPYVTDGEKLSGNGQIILDKAFAKERGFKVGDILAIYGKKFRVVGYALLPDYMNPLKNISDETADSKTFGVGVITPADFTEFQKGYTFYSVKFTKGSEKELIDYLNKSDNPILSWVDRVENNRISFVDAKINMIGDVVYPLPSIILVLTLILVANITTRLMESEINDIRTLYIVGYTKKEIIRHYLLYPVLISGSGSVIGTAAGVISSFAFMNYFSDYLSIPLLENEPSYIIPAISILIPIILATLLSCWAIAWFLGKALRNLTEFGIDS